jgi:hypothetical protein
MQVLVSFLQEKKIIQAISSATTTQATTLPLQLYRIASQFFHPYNIAVGNAEMVVSSNLKPENPLRNLLFYPPTFSTLPSKSLVTNRDLKSLYGKSKSIPKFVARWLFLITKATIASEPHGVARGKLKPSNFVEFGFRISQVPRLPDECRWNIEVEVSCGEM